MKRRNTAFIAIVAAATFLSSQAGYAADGPPGVTTLVGTPAEISVSDAEREDLATRVGALNLLNLAVKVTP